MSDFVQQQHTLCDFNSSDSWVVLSPIEQSIKRKIEAVGTPLKDWDINIYRGVLTGCNEAFIISTEKRNEILANCKDEEERKRADNIIRPILRGRDIKRYGYEWADLWLIATFPARNYDIEEYPAVKDYLLSFAEHKLRDAGYHWVADRYLADFCKQKLEQTGNIVEIAGENIKIGNTPEKARKKTSNKWFETQDSISYWEEFYKQQIIWIELSDEPKFALAESIMSVNTVFFMTGNHILHILGLLNSKLITWYFKNCLGTTSGVGTNRWLKYTIEQIPIAPVSTELERLGFEISRKYRAEKNTKIDLYACLLYNLSEKETNYIISQ